MVASVLRRRPSASARPATAPGGDLLGATGLSPLGVGGWAWRAEAGPRRRARAGRIASHTLPVVRWRECSYRPPTEADVVYVTRMPSASRAEQAETAFAGAAMKRKKKRVPPDVRKRRAPVILTPPDRFFAPSNRSSTWPHYFWSFPLASAISSLEECFGSLFGSVCARVSLSRRYRPCPILDRRSCPPSVLRRVALTAKVKHSSAGGRGG